MLSVEGLTGCKLNQTIIVKIFFAISEITDQREWVSLTAQPYPTGRRRSCYVKGERQPRYYRKHSVRFGEWTRVYSELIIDKEVIRKLPLCLPIIWSSGYKKHDQTEERREIV